ncbi:MAG TPA: hypothetical protein PK950_01325 [Candidatus Paceibacterota bacterium]|nr:hypothetical protein [Candidatus Paceibacterota bacterium]
MEKNNEKITDNDKESAITTLKAAIAANEEDDLSHRTFHLLRYFFHSLNNLECLIAEKKPRVGLEISFNGLFLTKSELFKTALKNATEYSDKEIFSKNVAYWSQDSERAIGAIMLLKYGEKHLGAILEFEKCDPYSKKETKESKMEWIKAKIKLEKTFLKDYFTEVDITKFDREIMTDRITEFLEDGMYPADFYEIALTALSDDFPATPGSGGIAFAVEHP